MNASRQPFVVSALLTALLVAACVFRGAGAPLDAIELSVCAILGVWTMVVVSQLAIKFAPGSSRNYLPIQVFAGVAAGATGVSWEGMVCGLCFALALRQSIFSMQKRFRFESVFRTGLYLGAAPFFCFPLVVASVATLLGVLVVYKRSVREWAVGWTGLLLPAGFVSFGCWALGRESVVGRLWEEALGAAWAEHWVGGLDVGGLIVLGSGVALGLCAVVGGLASRKQMRAAPGRFMAVVAVMFFSVLCLGAAPSAGGAVLPVVGLSVASVVPYGFSGRWSRASTVLYVVFVGAFFALVVKYNI